MNNVCLTGAGAGLRGAAPHHGRHQGRRRDGPEGQYRYIYNILSYLILSYLIFYFIILHYYIYVCIICLATDCGTGFKIRPASVVDSL
jgi:hypothetical protein